MLMAPKQRVMFVDDEEGVRQSWDRLLTERGFSVSTAADGARAQARLREEPADVVVADLRMPRVDGLQLLEWLRKEQPQTRFILVTGYGSEAVEERARELGAYGYLNKPVNPETLTSVISLALQVDLRTGGVTVSRLPTPAEAAVPSAAPALVEVQPAGVAAAAAVVKKSRLRSILQVAGGLVMAPLMGLAFVLFLPLIGFGGLFWVMGQAIWKHIGVSRA